MIVTYYSTSTDDTVRDTVMNSSPLELLAAPDSHHSSESLEPLFRPLYSHPVLCTTRLCF